MPNPDDMPHHDPHPDRPMPDWLKEIFNTPAPDPIVPFKQPVPVREKEPA